MAFFCRCTVAGGRGDGTTGITWHTILASGLAWSGGPTGRGCRIRSRALRRPDYDISAALTRAGAIMVVFDIDGNVINETYTRDSEDIPGVAEEDD